MEPYVGQLKVASFVGRCIKFAQVVNGNEVSQVDLTKSLTESDMQNRKRPVQIANHLRERIQLFVDVNTSMEEFQASCEREAEEDIASTDFVDKFLIHIGGTLVQEANIYLQGTLVCSPLWMYSLAAKKTRK